MARDVLSNVRQALPRLSSSEARVAEAIIADPGIVVDLTITDLAQLCGTSLSTVARFCQTLGYSGYREFRMEVASAISREAAERDRFGLADSDISPDDAAADVVAKIAFHEVLAIEQTVQGLDVEVLDRVVDAIAGARHVDLYGFGATVSAWMVSLVSPECEMPIATSPGFRSAAVTRARCTSTEHDAEMPMRASFCCRSWAVRPLAPNP